MTRSSRQDAPSLRSTVNRHKRTSLEVTNRSSCGCLDLITEIEKYTFKRLRDDWGFHDFLTTKEVEDATLGFLEDGWITLTARIEVLNQRSEEKTALHALL